MGNTNQPGGTKPIKSLEKWEDVVATAMKEPGVALPLGEIYARVDGHERTKVNPHWKDKVRQILQRSPLFENVEKGVWMLKRPAPEALGESEAR
jgi:hypothetical protein